MSAAALETLGANITALQRAIEASQHASTFNMRPAINAVLVAAVNVQNATRDVVRDLDSRVAALEAGRNASA